MSTERKVATAALFFAGIVTLASCAGGEEPEPVQPAGAHVQEVSLKDGSTVTCINKNPSDGKFTCDWSNAQ